MPPQSDNKLEKNIQRDSAADGKNFGGSSQIDVARLANVSQAAVSRTFTPGASVSQETREKVLAAARELGYRPNAIARSLIRKSTNIIGLVVMRFTNPFYARMIRDFTRELQEQGFWTLILNIAQDQELEKTLPMALQYQVDGLIVTSSTLSSGLAAECVRSGTPVVLFNRYAADTHTHVVRCDNVEGGRIVADAFLDSGHKRLAYIAGEKAASTNRDRETGFVDRLQERGHSLSFRESAEDYNYEQGYEAAQRLLQRDDPPDAIFCANDLIAMGALDLARYKLGIKIPEELSIIGFDDIPSAAWPGFELTTVKQPVKSLVDNTLQILMNAIKTPNSEVSEVVISPSLIWRNSSRKAKSSSPSSD
ncbi:MAG TPA: LacI family DNA-binding transcriptional regulator [Chloroflexi bacterium]|nr:LacI family DNA-binding transcriptional regulator [Chloroflexota bacterium]